MVLEKHIVLVGNAANSSEDIAFHEVVHIRSKAIDNLVRVSVSTYTVQEKVANGSYIMIIPNV